jgi:hypothetical protein
VSIREKEEKPARPVVPCLQARLRSFHGIPHLVAVRCASEAQRLRHGFGG